MLFEPYFFFFVHLLHRFHFPVNLIWFNLFVIILILLTKRWSCRFCASFAIYERFSICLSFRRLKHLSNQLCKLISRFLVQVGSLTFEMVKKFVLVHSPSIALSLSFSLPLNLFRLCLPRLESLSNSWTPIASCCPLVAISQTFSCYFCICWSVGCMFVFVFVFDSLTNRAKKLWPNLAAALNWSNRLVPNESICRLSFCTFTLKCVFGGTMSCSGRLICRPPSIQILFTHLIALIFFWSSKDPNSLPVVLILNLCFVRTVWKSRKSSRRPIWCHVWLKSRIIWSISWSTSVAANVWS